jgi:hypothetical protein
MSRELWDAFEAFLTLRHTGRVTFHVEQGVVRMVEATAFTRPNKKTPIDTRPSDPVQSP